MGELIEYEKHEVIDPDDDSRVVKINLTAVDKGYAATILDQIVDDYHIVKSKLSEVNPEKRYYLDLTKEMKEKLSSGECWFTEKSETGKPMGQLRHRVDGKSEIMANPDIVVEQVPVAQSNNPNQLTNGIYQIALQQQIAEMSYQMDEIRHTVERIESGQMDDRFSKIDAGENALRQAYRMADINKRESLILNAIPMIQDGSEEIKKVIHRRIKDFDEIPSKGNAIRARMWFTPTNYVERKSKEFDDIQTCFEYYDKAQRLMALAYMILEEPGAMEEVFFDQEKFIKSLETWKVKSIEHLHYNIDFSDEWFYTPGQFLNKTRLQYLDFMNGNYDVVSVEVTGKQMLEVLEYDKNSGSEDRAEEEQICEPESPDSES